MMKLQTSLYNRRVFATELLPMQDRDRQMDKIRERRNQGKRNTQLVPPKMPRLFFVQPINHLQHKHNPKTYTHVQSKPPRHRNNIYMSSMGELKGRRGRGGLGDDASNLLHRIIPVTQR